MVQKPPRSPGARRQRYRIHPALVASPVWQDLPRCRGKALSTAETGGTRRTCSANLSRPLQTPNPSWETRDASRQLPPIPELPLARCCVLPITSGGLGGWRGAAGGSAAPKLGSPTFGFVLIFQSSILQFEISSFH